MSNKLSEDDLRGKTTELLYIKSILALNPTLDIRQADLWEDRNKGIDVFVNGIGHQVKSKKFQRKVLYIPEHIPLEYKNVNGGPGSLFKYSIFYIFEFDKEFILFRTIDLQKKFLQLVDITKEPILHDAQGFWNPKTGYPLYTLIIRKNCKNRYTGEPNLDQFAYVHGRDLRYLFNKRIPKVISK